MAAKAAMKQGALVDGKELARILGVHPVTVRRMYLQKRIPFYQMGGPGSPVRFDVDEVKAALRDGRARGEG